jgi:hypothetical protein
MKIVAGIVPCFVLPTSIDQCNFHAIYSAGDEASTHNLQEISSARQIMLAATQHGDPASAAAAIDAYLPKLLSLSHAVVSSTHPDTSFSCFNRRMNAQPVADAEEVSHARRVTKDRPRFSHLVFHGQAQRTRSLEQKPTSSTRFSMFTVPALLTNGRMFACPNARMLCISFSPTPAGETGFLAHHTFYSCGTRGTGETDKSARQL